MANEKRKDRTTRKGSYMLPLVNAVAALEENATFPLTVYVEEPHAPDCRALGDTRAWTDDGSATWWLNTSGGRVHERRAADGRKSTTGHDWIRVECSATNCKGSVLVKMGDFARLIDAVVTQKRPGK